ncbi:hypothetical protein [Rhodopirellula baltica]|uniref:hypothetical protein n=1 Tax=Rhodopirellula baltica TaxID=265606 RepID=UPI00056700FC|nr:hypothetical protein [Rhodopirellula baltica]
MPNLVPESFDKESGLQRQFNLEENETVVLSGELTTYVFSVLGDDSTHLVFFIAIRDEVVANVTVLRVQKDCEAYGVLMTTRSEFLGKRPNNC